MKLTVLTLLLLTGPALAGPPQVPLPPQAPPLRAEPLPPVAPHVVAQPVAGQWTPTGLYYYPATGQWVREGGVSRPFRPAGITPGTRVPPVAGHSSAWPGSIVTAPTPTFALPAGLPGVTNCPPSG